MPDRIQRCRVSTNHRSTVLPDTVWLGNTRHSLDARIPFIAQSIRLLFVAFLAFIGFHLRCPPSFQSSGSPQATTAPDLLP
jgi:hypothetical protein